ncbi:LacI family transcriptional regulator [Kribbella sp. VKM Ac-2571]|uniref:LacI family DNA-binding transcriptional regulator n=1 Tax=Kribbella sp. VKM Ac-2571 TaxID=2512222 RepID=UPI0010ED6C89|nr:LacI family DNA-binding transcriptional regulator [Kribbella sp. VKM Ac-2571]TDO56718.1 LacI family transcriptional regulator [Kribbella sp. VKM Ac-2571]
MADSVITLSDVAAAAGVSLSTASKALNGTDRISEATREHVRVTADRLGFRHNALARSFARGRSQTIGVLTHRASNPFTRVVLATAATELGAKEQAILLYDARIDEHDVTESILQLRARRIDGVIVIGTGTSYPTPSLTSRFDVPVIYAFTFTEDPDDVTITAYDNEIGRLALGHLLSKGRRKIAHITAEPRDNAAQRRAAGAQEVLADAGLEWASPVRFGRWREGWGADAAAELLAEVPDVDAIFCGSDQIARGVERVVRASGRDVPGDVALIGVDNWEQLMHDQRVSRHLTTIDVGLEEIGRQVAAQLLEPGTQPGIQYVAPQVVTAETT